MAVVDHDQKLAEAGLAPPEEEHTVPYTPVTDFRHRAGNVRRYHDETLSTGDRVRVRSITARELQALKDDIEDDEQDYALIALCLVNEQNQPTHVMDFEHEEGYGYMAEMDAALFGELTTLVAKHCLPQLSREDTGKN